jgi:hypothetical protein
MSKKLKLDINYPTNAELVKVIQTLTKQHDVDPQEDLLFKMNLLHGFVDKWVGRNIERI